MNTLTIVSKKDREIFSFWMPPDGGYVRRVYAHRPGTLGAQICDGGKYAGNTLTATPNTFEAVCRRWYRAYQRQWSHGPQ